MDQSRARFGVRRRPLGGVVLINGQVAEPREELQGLSHKFPEEHPKLLPYNTEGRPLKLGDEYFVLGDLSIRASDSRDWGPVPSENKVGALAARHWPPQRRKFSP